MENEEFEKELRFKEIESFSHAHDDMPDGAFFALAEEMYDIGIDDWVWYSEECERRQNKINKK